MNFGVVSNEKIEDNIEYNLDKFSSYGKLGLSYLDILKHIRSGIGLDLSMHSTGVTIWEDEKLSHFVIDVSYYNDNEENMRREFKKALNSLMAGKDFEYVCVEDVYGGQNFVTVRNLVTLNTVPDEIVAENICNCEKFFRETNTEWKAALRSVAEHQKAVNDKVAIRQMLESLGFDISSLSRFNVNGKSDRDQDVADSLGLLLAVIVREKLGTYEKKKQYKLSDMKIWWCEDIMDYELCFNEGEEYKVISITRNFETSLRREIEDTEASMTLVCEVSTDILGTFGINRGIPLENDKVCIVCTPKTMKKPRRKKKKGTIIIS